jgi:hypothetical protein
MSRQEQRAGDGSTQIQASGDVNIGLTAADVFEIIRTENQRVIEECSSVARQTADDPIRSFGNSVREAFQDKPELFAAFGDPDFQYALADASRAAASNDDEHTERLLVDLLTNRAERGNTSRARLTTSQAIRAADKLSAEALIGITAEWAIFRIQGLPPHLVVAHLISAENVATKLRALNLPADQGWLDEADALGLVRITDGALMHRKPYKQLIQDRVAAELVPGFDPAECGPLVSALITSFPGLIEACPQHQLKEGFLRLPGNSREELLAQHTGGEVNGDLEQLINTNRYGARDPLAVTELERRVSVQPNAVAIAEWWDALRPASPTLIGQVIGFVNARRYLDFSGPQTVAELLQTA